MRDQYESPFSSRYASDEMQYLFSADYKFRTWRRLWIALAKAQKKLGLLITDEQIDQMERHADDINYEVAERREREVRHDVMSHVYAFGEQCPAAKPIIHLGATSCYVGDNTDIIVMRDALVVVRRKLVNVIALLTDFAREYRNMPALAYTHLQPAQLTTVGKRATLWIQDLMMDLAEVEYRIDTLKLLGSKGTTGTQASFMDLFDGNSQKILAMESFIAEDMGFSDVVAVSGQTYSRKVDAQVLGALSGVAQTCSKFSHDLRLLQSFKEMEEPFESQQIGSSAMPYKRNPMRCERITSLSRYVMVDCLNPALTAATQWFERTLDDSANRRIAVSEAFLAVDSILGIMLNVCDGLVVYPQVIARRVWEELPFMATETIMMRAVKRGGDRQILHERLRQHSIDAGRMVKEYGEPNDLLQRIAADSSFGMSMEELEGLLDPVQFTGRACEQTEEYLLEFIVPMLEKNRGILGEKSQLSV